MPTTVQIRLHDKRAADRLTDIDLDRLSPIARALAEHIAGTQYRNRQPVPLTSVQTKAELGLDPLWHGPDMDAHHITTWNGWADNPARSTLDPHEYLEDAARQLPAGYIPTGATSRAAAVALELVTKAQAMDLLRSLGRPISPATWDNYRSRPPAGWPQPTRHIGRTPMWRRADIETYAHAAQ